jgi:hypothetical protein
MGKWYEYISGEGPGLGVYSSSLKMEAEHSSKKQ